jgi:hypothetical protein
MARYLLALLFTFLPFAAGYLVGFRRGLYRAQKGGGVQASSRKASDVQR